MSNDEHQLRIDGYQEVLDRFNKIDLSHEHLQKIEKDQELTIVELPRFILEKEDAIEFTSLLYEAIDHYDLKVKINVEKSKNCVIITGLVISVLGGTIAGVASPYIKQGIDGLGRKIKRFFKRKVRDEEIQRED